MYVVADRDTLRAKNRAFLEIRSESFDASYEAEDYIMVPMASAEAVEEAMYQAIKRALGYEPRFGAKNGKPYVEFDQ